MAEGCTAMIVDPYAETAAELRAHLERQQIQVVEWASSGTGWISTWQRLKPDLLFVELQLPKRDGLYGLSKVRELDPSAKVVFIHAYQGMMANDVELKALARGAAAVLQRPFIPNRFRAVVGRVFELHMREKKLLERSRRPA